MKQQLHPEKQGFRDFDLPKEHLLDDRHFVPAKTHDRSEALRRRELNRGTLVAEQQLRGLHVARTILQELNEQEGLIFAANTLAVAGINSAWYSYAQRSTDVMRRRLKLPIMLHPRSRTPEYVLEDAVELLGSAEKQAGVLVANNEHNPRRVDRSQRDVGVATGNVALHLATFEAVCRGDFLPPSIEDGMSDGVMQDHARAIALDMLSDARTMHRIMGSHPSIAQLSDPYSHLSVYWHRKAPASAQTAVVEALAS